MLTRHDILLRVIATFTGIASCIAVQSPHAQTIIDEWANVKVPPAPTLTPVTIDNRSTALLMLDFNRQTCNSQRRPRCIASIPKVKVLLTAARAAGVPVFFSLGGGGKVEDIAKELSPASNEPVVSSGVDKFVGTDLEKFLREKGIATVIVVGDAANGAVIYTASSAAMRGLKVVIPVDGVSADIPYAEQYTAWHLTHAPVISSAFTLTTIDGVKF